MVDHDTVATVLPCDAGAVRRAVADADDPTRRRGQNRNACLHGFVIGNTDIGTLVAIIGQRPAGKIPGAGSGVGVDILLDKAVVAQRAVKRQPQLQVLCQCRGRKTEKDEHSCRVARSRESPACQRRITAHRT